MTVAVAAIPGRPSAPLPGPGWTGFDPTLVEGFLAKIRAIVGDEAATALFHYAANQQGRAHASGAGATWDQVALRLLEPVLGSDAKVALDTADVVRVQFAGDRLEGEERLHWRALALGLLEGILSEARGRTWTARYEPRMDGVNVAAIEIRDSKQNPIQGALK